VRWHRYVSNERLLELYGHARAFAFLSEYEGLGMTPLEALAAGVPPVVYDTAVARESYADAALYVQVGDGAGIVRALERALFDEQTRAAILAAAPAVLAKYDWPRAAREMLTVIENAARSG
jgi:alpha-1,3-rhamnosyl/mannosyltransferase